MLALRLVRLIEDHSDELAEGLTHRLLSSDRAKALRHVPANELHERCHEVYRHLSDWLLNKTEADIEQAYRKLGTRRAHQGVGLADVVWALFQTNEHLWSFLEQQGVHAQPHYLYGEFELLHVLGQFFDRAVYYTTAGYEEAVASQVA